MTIVVFNPTIFLARYPEFSSISTNTLSAYFNEACLYCDNSDVSIIRNINERTLLLNMLVAHIAFLTGRPVGRLTNASEGSVSGIFEMKTPGTTDWFNQSQYGAAFIQATKKYRSMRYIPQPTVIT
jgi:Protein of unknown function (DUF4054)